jgi:hypothetical protein
MSTMMVLLVVMGAGLWFAAMSVGQWITNRRARKEGQALEQWYQRWCEEGKR